MSEVRYSIGKNDIQEAQRIANEFFELSLGELLDKWEAEENDRDEEYYMRIKRRDPASKLIEQEPKDLTWHFLCTVIGFFVGLFICLFGKYLH